MSTLPATVRSKLRRARIRAKAFSYSGPGRDRWQRPDQVVSALAPVQGDLIADIGSGGGYFTVRLARAIGPAGTVYAVDTDPDMVAAVSERAAAEGLTNVVTVEAAPEDPALPEPVDLALIVDAFHHLPDPGAYAKALARHFRPRGRLAVIEPPRRWFMFGHGTDPDDIRATLRAAGYDQVAEHAFLPRQSFLVFERRTA